MMMMVLELVCFALTASIAIAFVTGLLKGVIRRLRSDRGLD